MKIETKGTLIDGVVQLDEAVDLPNHSRVSVTVRPLTQEPREPKAALERFLRRAEARQFDSRGLRFTRDELHERR